MRFSVFARLGNMLSSRMHRLVRMSAAFQRFAWEERGVFLPDVPSRRVTTRVAAFVRSFVGRTLPQEVEESAGERATRLSKRKSARPVGIEEAASGADSAEIID